MANGLGISKGDSWRSSCLYELQSYQHAPKLEWSGKNEKLLLLDPLEWWRSNHYKFPTLWKLAQVYLAIPASAAASERAFSVAGNIVSQQRCGLSSLNVSDLHFVHENKWLLYDAETTEIEVTVLDK